MEGHSPRGSLSEMKLVMAGTKRKLSMVDDVDTKRMKALLKRNPTTLPSEILLDVAGCVDFNTLVPMRFSNARLNGVVLRHSHKLARQRQFRLYCGIRLELIEEYSRVFEVVCKHNSRGPCVECLRRANDFVGAHRITRVSFSIFWQKEVSGEEFARALPAVCYAERVTIEKDFVHDDYTGAVMDYLNIFRMVQHLTLESVPSDFDWPLLQRKPFVGLRHLTIQPPGAYYRRKWRYGEDAEAEVLRFCFSSLAREDGSSTTVDLSGWRFSKTFKSIVVQKLFPRCSPKTTVRLIGSARFERKV